jgi:hypothetical protein
MNKQSISVNKQGNMEIMLMVAILKEENYFVAYCPALEISAYAKDLDSAKSEFNKELTIFFDETIKKGTLERLLLSYGWTLKPKEFQPPKPTAKLINQLNKYPNIIYNEEKFRFSYV